jgi:hypothetical protein
MEERERVGVRNDLEVFSWVDEFFIKKTVQKLQSLKK